MIHRQMHPSIQKNLVQNNVFNSYIFIIIKQLKLIDTIYYVIKGQSITYSQHQI